jgi:hypothetical protein
VNSNKWCVITASASVAVLAGVGWVMSERMQTTATITTVVGSHVGTTFAQLASEAVSFGSSTTGKGAQLGGAVTTAATVNPLDTVAPPVCRATSRGDLLVNPQIRVDLERVYALHTQDEAMVMLDTCASHLPLKAQRDVKNLYQQYAQYSKALLQTYPPGLNVDTVDEASQQLNGIHDLRQQYFGVDGAEAMFGEEEKTTREMLLLMRQQTDPKLTMEERAEHAQAEWAKNHPSP